MQRRFDQEKPKDMEMHDGDPGTEEEDNIVVETSLCDK